MARKRVSFEQLFEILSNVKFRKMEGLGNEVPFFVQTYDIKHQQAIYDQISKLHKRLAASGIPVLTIGLYDLVIEYLSKNGKLEKTFAKEPSVDKEKFAKEMGKIISIDKVIVPQMESKRRANDPKIVFLYQVGEVYPFLRTHNLLEHLQSRFGDIPLIVFFPGEYVTSYDRGFYLALFGKSEFKGDYYRAFKLEDYKIRGRL